MAKPANTNDICAFLVAIVLLAAALKIFIYPRSEAVPQQQRQEQSFYQKLL
jgi:hypothetical protein